MVVGLTVPALLPREPDETPDYLEAWAAWAAALPLVDETEWVDEVARRQISLQAVLATMGEDDHMRRLVMACLYSVWRDEQELR